MIADCAGKCAQRHPDENTGCTDNRALDYEKCHYPTRCRAHRSDDGNVWEIVGLISLMDPPRADAKATIAEAKAHRGWPTRSAAGAGPRPFGQPTPRA